MSQYERAKEYGPGDTSWWANNPMLIGYQSVNDYHENDDMYRAIAGMKKTETKNEIKLTINFDAFGMPYIDNPNADTEISIERGNFWKLYRQQGE